MRELVDLRLRLRHLCRGVAGGLGLGGCDRRRGMLRGLGASAHLRGLVGKPRDPMRKLVDLRLRLRHLGRRRVGGLGLGRRERGNLVVERGDPRVRLCELAAQMIGLGERVARLPRLVGERGYLLHEVVDEGLPGVTLAAEPVGFVRGGLRSLGTGTGLVGLGRERLGARAGLHEHCLQGLQLSRSVAGGAGVRLQLCSLAVQQLEPAARGVELCSQAACLVRRLDHRRGLHREHVVACP